MHFKARDLHNLDLATIMDRWPQTLQVFVQHNVLCIGCTIAPFHMISDTCREHDLDEDILLDDLVAAINSHQ